jgi:hypothetical protein
MLMIPHENLKTFRNIKQSVKSFNKMLGGLNGCQQSEGSGEERAR